MRPRRTGPLAVLAIACAATTVPAAHAADFTLARTPTPAFAAISEPRLSIDPAGVITVAWADESGTVFARTRTPGGDWGPATVLGEGLSSVESVASGANGTAAVAWLSSERQMVVSRRSPDGTWSEPVPLAPQVPQFDMTGGPGEQPVAVWAVRDEVRTSSPNPDGSWSEPAVLWRQGSVSKLTATTSARGEVILTWIATVPRRGRFVELIRVATRDASGQWRVRPDVSRGTGPDAVIGGTPDVATNTRGDIVLSWIWQPPRGVPGKVRIVRRSPSGRWSAPRSVADSTVQDTSGAASAIALDQRGRATIVWRQRLRVLDYELRAALCSVANRCSRSTRVALPGRRGALGQGVVVSASGRASIYWTPEGPAAKSAVVTSVRGNSGRWGRPRTVSPYSGWSPLFPTAIRTANTPAGTVMAWAGARGLWRVEVATSRR